MTQSVVPGLAFSAATSKPDAAAGACAAAVRRLVAGEHAAAMTEPSNTALSRKMRGANPRRRLNPVAVANTRPFLHPLFAPR